MEDNGLNEVRKPIQETPMRTFLIPFLTFFAMAAIIFGIYQIIETSQFKQNAVPVVAVINEVTKNKDSDGKVACTVSVSATIVGNKKEIVSKRAYSYFPIVSFILPDGQEKISTYDSGLVRPMEEGSKRDILYDEKNPDKFSIPGIKGDKAVNLLIIVMILMGLVFWGAMVVLGITSQLWNISALLQK